MPTSASTLWRARAADGTPFSLPGMPVTLILLEVAAATALSTVGISRRRSQKRRDLAAVDPLEAELQELLADAQRDHRLTARSGAKYS